MTRSSVVVHLLQCGELLSIYKHHTVTSTTITISVLTAVFHVVASQSSSSTCSGTKPVRISGTGFFISPMPLGTVSVNALMEFRRTNPNQETSPTGVIISSCNTRFLTERSNAPCLTSPVVDEEGM